ncbi:MAG: hypothetical protein HYT76_02070 [Deltaproteobacteria bacterium]|nr:hypothetical protein [Deltaproteobacteria bacterium]
MSEERIHLTRAFGGSAEVRVDEREQNRIEPQSPKTMTEFCTALGQRFRPDALVSKLGYSTLLGVMGDLFAVAGYGFARRRQWGEVRTIWTSITSDEAGSSLLTFGTSAGGATPLNLLLEFGEGMLFRRCLKSLLSQDGKRNPSQFFVAGAAMLLSSLFSRTARHLVSHESPNPFTGMTAYGMVLEYCDMLLLSGFGKARNRVLGDIESMGREWVDGNLASPITPDGRKGPPVMFMIGGGDLDDIRLSIEEGRLESIPWSRDSDWISDQLKSRLEWTSRHDPEAHQRILSNLRRYVQDSFSLGLNAYDAPQWASRVDSIVRLLPPQEQLAYADSLLFHEAVAFGKPFQGRVYQQIAVCVMPFMESRMFCLAGIYGGKDFSRLVESVQKAPIFSAYKINRLRALAEDLEYQGIDGIHHVVHRRPGDYTVDFLKRALGRVETEEPHKTDLIAALKECLSLASEVYEGKLEARPPGRKPAWLDSTGDVISLSRSIGDFICDLKEGRISREVTGEDLVHLAQLSVSLQKEAFGACRYEESEHVSALQARKIATLVMTLYGSGYGHCGWKTVADRLFELSERWEQLRSEERERQLKINAALAREIVLQVQDSYHEHFDPLVERFGDLREFSADERANFSGQLYASMATLPLSIHVQKTCEGQGDRQTANRVLSVLQHPYPSYPYKGWFYGDADMPADRRVIGNKGASLHEMKQRGLKVPIGFVLPARLAGTNLSVADEQAIDRALDRLEKLAGRSLEDGSLEVYVRSGAGESLEGQMRTIPDVKGRKAVKEAIHQVYQSADDEGARALRLINGVPDEWGTAVNIVVKVDATRGGAGVFNSGREPVFKRGVPGRSLADSRAFGTDELDRQYRQILEGDTERLENFYGYPLEVEFTIEDGQLYYLQVRHARLEQDREIRWYAERVRLGKLDADEAIKRLGGKRRLENSRTISVLQETTGHPFSQQRKGGGTPLSGRIALSHERVLELRRGGDQPIFVADNPDTRVSTSTSILASGLIFRGGNDLSHLEAIARMTRTSFVRSEDLVIDGAVSVRLGNDSYQEGEVVTLDPSTGRIFRGEIPVTTRESSARFDIEYLLSQATSTVPNP